MKESYVMYYDTCRSGKRIQELRKAHEMTQAQLAEALSISLDHLRKIEGGQRGCSVDLLITLAAALNVPSRRRGTSSRH